MLKFLIFSTGLVLASLSLIVWRMRAGKPSKGSLESGIRAQLALDTVPGKYLDIGTIAFGVFWMIFAFSPVAAYDILGDALVVLSAIVFFGRIKNKVSPATLRLFGVNVYEDTTAWYGPLVKSVGIPTGILGVAMGLPFWNWIDLPVDLLYVGFLIYVYKDIARKAVSERIAQAKIKTIA